MHIQIEIPGQREPSNLRHHFDLGRMWLERSERGAYGAPLIYAGFEFRLTIEHFCFQYLASLRGGSLTSRDKSKIIRSYDNMRDEIRAFTGNQKAIDRTYDFLRIILNELKLPLEFVTPNIKTLTNFYEYCSNTCHIRLNLICDESAVRDELHTNLLKVCEYLDPLATQASGFPIFTGSALDPLRQRFVDGEDIEAELRAFINQNGLYATFDPKDGSGEKVVAVRAKGVA